MFIKSRIVKYKIHRNANDVIYDDTTIVKPSFVNSSNYKSKGICRNIETNPNGNVVSGAAEAALAAEAADTLFCYKKEADKGKASKSKSNTSKK
jgi:hypothetical protein